MDWIPQIFRRRKIYSDLSEEILCTFEERTEQLVREGKSPKQAEREARVAFGNRVLLEEQSRSVAVAAGRIFALHQIAKYQYRADTAGS